ncbi:phage tail protein [Reinekea sp. G2M2-21]|uniref:phage tail protein n=1 Tax=Reinekea sp. G2M2-21 TaxID=2788942 RepID=UPI0018AA4D8F|nr:phage tail protein [Reinekea sp. G2M2-21]
MESLAALAQSLKTPPTAFFFQVSFVSSLGQMDTSFQEVSGITTKLETDTYNEGGENRFAYKLPKGITHSNLVLKRGIDMINSPLVIWCKSVFELDFSVSIQTQPLAVYLMNEYNIPIRAWTFFNAFPVSWEVDPFNSTKNELAIEKIELSYDYSMRLF